MKVFQILLLLFISNIVSAQTTVNNKGYAFFKSYLPGRQTIDENGKPTKPIVTLERFIFLECKKGITVNVLEVKYNNFTTKPNEVKLAENRILVGAEPSTGLPITIKAKKGYVFWMLTLKPILKDDKTFGKLLCGIRVKTMAGAIPLNFFLKKEIELVAPEMN